MNASDNPYHFDQSFDTPVAQAAVDVRAEFIRKTYAHLFGAVALFAGLLAMFTQVEQIRDPLLQLMLASKWGMLIFIGLFLVVSYVANRWAVTSTSRALQYAGLGLFCLVEAVIFVPLIVYAELAVPGSHVVEIAAIATLLVFGGLTLVVFMSKADFSFLGGFLTIATFASMALILGAMIFGFNLGMFFSVLMIVLAAGWILYDTSNVLHTYNSSQHVAAALALFSSLAMLFYYVLRLAIAIMGEE